MPLSPQEADLWRQALAGQQPDPSMLYAQPAGTDPSAGLPPGAVAGPPVSAQTATDALREANAWADPAAVAQTEPQLQPQNIGQAQETLKQQIAPPLATGLVPQNVAPSVQQAVQQIQEQQRPRAPTGPAEPGGVPDWLQQYATQEGIKPEPPETDPHLPGAPETPNEQAARRQLQGETFAGVEDQYEAQKYAHEATMRAQQAAEDARQRIDLENRQREQERINKMRERESAFRQMADAAQKEPIDSNRIWNQASTGEKIMQRLAVFLGTLGTAQGGPNFAMQKIEADIDRDIAAQKANKESKFKRLADEATLYDMASKTFEDESSVEAAARESAYRKVAQQLDFFGQHVQDPARRAAVDQMKRELDAKILDTEQQRRRANEVYVMQWEAAQEKARAEALAAKKPKPFGKEASSELEKREIEMRAGVETLNDVIGRLEKTNAVSDPSVRRQLMESAASAAGNIEGYRQRTKEEMETTKTLVGEGLGGELSLQRMKAYRDEARRKLERMRRQKQQLPSPEGVK